jgi:transcriptional regulator with GAF, ATPase, and Fis domain
MITPSPRRAGPATVPGARAAGVLADTRAALDATRDILRVLARSRGDTQPVFEAIARLALSLCHANSACVFTYDGALVHVAATAFTDPATGDALRKLFPRAANRDTAATRAILTRAVTLIPDVTTDAEYRLRDEGLREGFRSVLAVPLLYDREPVGAIAIARPEPGPYGHNEVALLESFAEQAVIAIDRARLGQEVGARSATIRALVEDTRATDRMIGRSDLLAELREQVVSVAAADGTVLLEGETGTGKEIVARAIHAASARHDRPFIRLACAALPPELVEGELFGHEKGVFSSAFQQRQGRLELADGGTLFLDEIAELPLEAQSKLRRVLQERQFEHVGGTRTLSVNVRVIASTNRDLRREVKEGRFLADLHFRLGVFHVTLPPLRARPDDVPLLLEHYARLAARRLGRPYEGLEPGFVARARTYSWPGNVRELEHVVERAVLLSPGGPLDASGAVSRRPATVR